MRDEEQTQAQPAPDDTEEVGTGIDFTDPLKRNDDDDRESMPGLDPVVSLPPE